MFGSRFRGIAGGIAAFSGLVGPPAVLATILAALYLRFGDVEALRRILAGIACSAVGLLIATVFRMMTPLFKRRDIVGLVLLAAVFVAIALLRLPLPAVLLVGIPLSIAITMLVRKRVCNMNSDGNPIWTLAGTFGVTSLFAVGGGNAAVPEMHRVAVDVQHWMTERQFADVFAISQMSPGPNVLIVTLIGYFVAGVTGALVATLAMCGPTAILAYFVNRLLARSSHSRWPAIIQAALVPLSIGLMSASGFILARSSDRTVVAALMTAITAWLAFATELNPLWLLLAGGLLGFAGLV